MYHSPLIPCFDDGTFGLAGKKGKGDWGKGDLGKASGGAKAMDMFCEGVP